MIVDCHGQLAALVIGAVDLNIRPGDPQAHGHLGIFLRAIRLHDL
ncbi:MAG: hypothetical protein ACLSHO_07530 [Dysosmobacter sp.]